MHSNTELLKLNLLQTKSLFSIYLITCRYRGRSSDLTSHWLPGRQWQSVAGIYVFWQAEERPVISDQSPAQHIQTAIPPHTGSSVNIMTDGNGDLCDDRIVGRIFFFFTKLRDQYNVFCFLFKTGFVIIYRYYYMFIQFPELPNVCVCVCV